MAKEKEEPVAEVTETLQADLAPMKAEPAANPAAVALRLVARRLRTLAGCNDIQHGKNISRVADELDADAAAIEGV